MATKRKSKKKEKLEEVKLENKKLVKKDEIVENEIKEVKKSPSKPKTIKLKASQNYKLWDGRFVREGAIIEVDTKYGERLLLSTNAFSLVGEK